MMLTGNLLEQNRTNVSVNDFIAKAATRALQDVVSSPKVSSSSSKGIVYNTDVSSFAESYKGGSFK